MQNGCIITNILFAVCCYFERARRLWREGGGETDRLTDRLTDTQTDGRTDRQTEIINCQKVDYTLGFCFVVVVSFVVVVRNASAWAVSETVDPYVNQLVSLVVVPSPAVPTPVALPYVPGSRTGMDTNAPHTCMSPSLITHRAVSSIIRRQS